MGRPTERESAEARHGRFTSRARHVSQTWRTTTSDTNLQQCGYTAGVRCDHADQQDDLCADESMQQLHAMIDALSNRRCTVMITGETGTGKEVVAKRIHDRSDRSEGPFVPVDCTALRDTLFESQLFGHVKGAFTGAERDTIGFFRSAHAGTLFLDEVGELSLEIQAKLLRSIQEQTVVPLGSTEPIKVDVRIVTATHRHLRAMVQEGTFREDLYFRLNVIRLEIPPLRDRITDICNLGQYFLRQQAMLYDEPEKYLDEQAREYMQAYRWPGNVRELANAMERAYVLSTNEWITPSELPHEIVSADNDESCQPDKLPTIDEAVKNLVRTALEKTNGRKMAAARMLGVERRRLNRLIENFQLEAV